MEATQVHHLIPISFGGDNRESNLIPLCDEHHAIVHNLNSHQNHSELTKLGIERARAAGKQIGLKSGTKLTTKKSIKSKELIQKYSKDFCGTLDDTEVMKLTGISRNTYYKYKRELKIEINDTN